MTFNPGIPNPGDKLRASQPVLLDNNIALDNTFGVDHKNFSDATTDSGKHNKVTTPVFMKDPPGVNSEPPETKDDPIIYAFQVPAPPDPAKSGVLHFSRGPNNAVPTPITFLQSTEADKTYAASQTKTILDFTGIKRAVCILTIASLTNPEFDASSRWFIKFGLNLLTAKRMFSSGRGPSVYAKASGFILQAVASGEPQTEVYWTLEFLRLE